MMSDCVAFYQNQARQRMSTQPWLLNRQEQACEQLEQLGFPTRHDEDWKYTSVDSFLQHRFIEPASKFAVSSEVQGETEQRAMANPSSLDTPVSSYLLSIVDGVLTTPSLLDRRDQLPLPAGVVIMPLLEALDTLSEKVTPWLGNILKSEHAFHALNTAMLSQGLFIYIPEQVELLAPLWIRHFQSKANQAIHLRHLIVADKGSRASVIEEYCGNADLCYYTNTVTETLVAERAALTHYKIQRESKLAYHVGHVAVKQAAHSQFDSHSFCVGGQWMRSDIHIDLEGAHANCSMNGMYVPLDGQHMDHHTQVLHTVPDCQSVQDYKGILKGRARAVFNGRVVVSKGAQHTVAKQQNKNLLLSAQAEIDTKPQLDIYADDVVCTHGATVGQLDEDALFYLATRGLEHDEASRFLLQAFMTENLRAIPNEGLAAWIGNLFIEQIG